MELLLVRHAIAAERDHAADRDDRARPLPAEGRKRMAEVASCLAQVVTPTEVLTSPLLRARQTAEILARSWRLKVSELGSLGNGDHPGTLSAVAQRTSGTVALVGHEPWMGELLSYLLTGDPEAVSAPFKKGGAALVEAPGSTGAGEWVLRWAMPPSALRRLR